MSEAAQEKVIHYMHFMHRTKKVQWGIRLASVLVGATVAPTMDAEANCLNDDQQPTASVCRRLCESPTDPCNITTYGYNVINSFLVMTEYI